MKKLVLGFTALAAINTLAACSDTSNAVTNSGNEGELRIEVIAKGFQHDFWQAVNQGAEMAAENYGVNINFVGPSSETAIQEQVDMVNSAINRQPDAIALAALDTNALLDALNNAVSSNIPIIGFDSGIPDAPEGAIAGNASTDNFAAGALAAEHLFEEILSQIGNGEAVRIGVISQEVNSLSIYARTAGFIETMIELIGSNGYNVAVVGHSRFQNDVAESDADTIIEVRVPAQVTDSAGRSEAMALLNRADLIAIYGSNEFGANAIINADDGLSTGRIGNDVVAVGFDAGTLQQNAVREQRFFGSITQNPVMIGYYAVSLAIRAINGETVGDIDTGAAWWNHENIDDPAIQELLYD